MEQLDPKDPNDQRFASEQSVDSNGDPVLKLRGELDMMSAVPLRETVEKIAAQHCDRLVFDLSDLEFMDSSGIAVLVYAANNVGTVSLHNASPIIRRIVEATGLTDFLLLDPQ
jgi:anti-sigma B factor antagonist